MFDKIKTLFKREPWQWVGRIHASWNFNDGTATRIHYDLYAKSNGRRMYKGYGYNNKTHQISRLIEAWVDGSPNNLMFQYIDGGYLPEYWEGCYKEEEIDEPKRDFKLLNFEKKKEENAEE